MRTITTLGHDDAQRAIAAIRDEMLRRGKAGVIAVVDAAGETIALLRLDGAPRQSVTIATNKAFSAAREGRETEQIGERARTPGSGFEMVYFGDPRFVGWPGGIPVVVDGAVVGAVGVSGLPGEVDVELARIGIAAILGEGSGAR
jgi:glc operon protein GlcG